MQTFAVITFDGQNMVMFGKIKTNHSIPPLVDAIRFERTGRFKFPNEVALFDIEKRKIYHVRGTRDMSPSEAMRLSMASLDTKTLRFENYEFS